jgi:hypothetical protein
MRRNLRYALKDSYAVERLPRHENAREKQPMLQEHDVYSFLALSVGCNVAKTFRGDLHCNG